MGNKFYSGLEAARRGFVKGGGGVFKCRSCNRGCRSIGNGDNENCKLCPECFDLAGEENSLSDNGKFYDSPVNVLAMIAAVAKRGDASCWDDLKKKAEKAVAAQVASEAGKALEQIYPFGYVSKESAP